MFPCRINWLIDWSLWRYSDCKYCFCFFVSLWRSYLCLTVWLTIVPILDLFNSSSKLLGLLLLIFHHLFYVKRWSECIVFGLMNDVLKVGLEFYVNLLNLFKCLLWILFFQLIFLVFNLILLIVTCLFQLILIFLPIRDFIILILQSFFDLL